MPVLDHVIEGNLLDGQNIDFSTEKIAVHAFVKGQEVASADVDTLGRFKISFTSEEERPETELRITPAEPAEVAPITAATEKVDPLEFTMEERVAKARTKLQITQDALEAARHFGIRYNMFGTVFSQTKYEIEPAPALKMDFYEFDWRLIPGGRPVLKTPSISPFGKLTLPELEPAFRLMRDESYLGTAFTDLDGKYSFSFAFSSTFDPPWLRPDPQPDILVRISESFNGEWNEVFCGPVDWDIVPKFHRDFLVPALNLRQISIKLPLTGFSFTSIGFIPCDSTHVVQGYANTDAACHPSIANIKGRPFGDLLTFYGGFAAQPAVQSYKVQVAPTTTLQWQDVLYTLYAYNSITHLHELLGPDPATHRYRNADLQPALVPHGMKFLFNSRAVPDGLYVFRILGFDAAGNQVGVPVQSIPIRIDNTVPRAALEAVNVSVCGRVSLPAARTLPVRVTAYDPAGHALRFGLSATRGRNPLAGDAVITGINPPVLNGVPGIGVLNQTETLTIGALPAALAGCSALAYNLELCVQGASTDGFSRELASQRVVKQMNLIVIEP